MKTGGGYLARLAARAATPAVAPRPILFHTEMTAPSLDPLAGPPVPREIVPAASPLTDVASVWTPVAGAPSRSGPSAEAAASILTPPLEEVWQPASVAQAAVRPPQPATLSAIALDPLRSALQPAAIPLKAEPAPPRPAEQAPRKSESPEGAAAGGEPIEAELSPSLEALERITGLWQARAVRQPSHESAAARAPSVTIGTLEVRVTAPPAPVPAPRRAPSPSAPLARGFRAFGLRQS
jgi:hypothetical protein